MPPVPGWTRTLPLAASGPAPADAVWERYAVPTAWPDWSPQVRRVEASAGRIAPGTSGTVHGWGSPPVRFTVTSVDEAARTWAWDVRLGPVSLHLDHGVDALPGLGSRTWVHLRGPAPVALAYAPLARLALQRIVS